MNAIVAPQSSLPVPVAPSHIAISPAQPADEAFVDHCQKMFAGHLGFLYSGTISKKIARNEVLVAKDQAGAYCGYVMGTTSYDRNDAVSRIDQIAVVPRLQRRQLGGALLARWIDGLPYGVTLICCWCAQDLREGRFWEAEGFVPLAFRAGGMAARRVHIFWQRRVRRGDNASPFWYPKETANGAMGAARLILPIPPGADWKEVDLPRVLPEEQADALDRGGGPIPPEALTSKGAAKGLLTGSVVKPAITPAEYAARQRERSALLKPRGPVSPAIAGRTSEARLVLSPPPTEQKKTRPKNQAGHVAAARELRDRFLEQINASGVVEQGRYDPSRSLSAAPSALAGALLQGLVPKDVRRLPMGR